MTLVRIFIPLSFRFCSRVFHWGFSSRARIINPCKRTRARKQWSIPHRPRATFRVKKSIVFFKTKRLVQTSVEQLPVATPSRVVTLGFWEVQGVFLTYEKEFTVPNLKWDFHWVKSSVLSQRPTGKNIPPEFCVFVFHFHARKLIQPFAANEYTVIFCWSDLLANLQRKFIESIIHDIFSLWIGFSVRGAFS